MTEKELKDLLQGYDACIERFKKEAYYRLSISERVVLSFLENENSLSNKAVIRACSRYIGRMSAIFDLLNALTDEEQTERYQKIYNRYIFLRDRVYHL